MKKQIIFLHAPSILAPRQSLPGLFGDSIDGEGYFGRFPLGFLSLSNYLSERGWECRILNLAGPFARKGYHKALSRLKGLNADIVGIDIHWLLHAPGALKAAQLIKQFSPQTKIVVGGLSASYYYQELIVKKEIDFIIRGESTELPLYQLLTRLESGKSFDDVPNLVWKDGDCVHVNSATYSPDTIEVDYSYKSIIRNVFKYKDFWGSLPSTTDWLTSLSGVITCRGCSCTCANCGGSNFALGRSAVVKRRPEDIVGDAVFARDFTPPKDYIMLFGDIRMGDHEGIISGLAEAKIINPIRYELFWPASPLFLSRLGTTTRKLCISFSPESHDENIRKAFGKPYTNAQLEQMIAAALDMGAELSLFFMIGLPYQSADSVRETYRYIQYLLETYAKDKPGKLLPCIYTLAPYLDPGSPAFCHPDRYGYRLFYRSLEQHIGGLTSQNPARILNYETVKMSREEIIQVGYEMAVAMTLLQEKHGLCAPRDANKRLARLKQEQTSVEQLLRL